MKKLLSWILVGLIMCASVACDKSKMSDSPVKRQQQDALTKHAQNARKAQKNKALSAPSKISSSASLVAPSSAVRSLGKVSKGEEINIAVLLPLSGAHERMGRSMLDAIQMASAELGSSKINLMIVDVGSNATTASTALSNIDKKADIVIGPALQEQLSVISQYSAAKGLATIALVNDRAFANKDGLYMLGMPIEQQMSRLLSFAIHHDVKRVYTILPKNSFGAAVADTLIEYKKSKALDDFIIIPYSANAVSSDSGFNKIAQDLRAHIQNDSNGNEVALLLPQYGADLKQIGQIFEFIGNKNIKVLVGSNFHDGAIKGINGGQAWFADVALAARLSFETKFRKAHNYEPHHLATLAYDAVALILAVTEIVKDDKLLFNPNSLLNTAGFEGINGVFRFAEDGSGERLLSVFRAESGQITEVDQSLSSFE